MPTLNPRVQVTLSPSLDALVRQMAVYQRASKSQVLRELLEAAEPALRRAVALMDAATQATQEVRRGLARSLDKAQDQAEHSLAGVLSGLDAASADLVAMAEEVRARRPAKGSVRASQAVASGTGNPPASNRGVKSHAAAPRKGPGRVKGKGPTTAPKVKLLGARS